MIPVPGSAHVTAGPGNPPTLWVRRAGSFTGDSIARCKEKKLDRRRGLGLVRSPHEMSTVGGAGVQNTSIVTFRMDGSMEGESRVSPWGRFRVHMGLRSGPGAVLGTPLERSWDLLGNLNWFTSDETLKEFVFSRDELNDGLL